MAPVPEKFQPALFGGLFIGVLSALPLIGAANCICCMWVVAGGMLSAYLMQQNFPYPISAADGALVGLIAGFIGGIVSGLLLIPIALMFGPVQQRFIERLVLSNPNVPEQTKEMMQNMARNSAVFGVVAIIRMCVMSVIFAIFGMLGGLLGVSLFKKKDLPPPGTTEVMPPTTL